MTSIFVMTLHLVMSFLAGGYACTERVGQGRWRWVGVYPHSKILSTTVKKNEIGIAWDQRAYRSNLTGIHLG